MRLSLPYSRLSVFKNTPDSVWRFLVASRTPPAAVKSPTSVSVFAPKINRNTGTAFRRSASTTNSQDRVQAPNALTGNEIRERFLRFFEQRGHERLPSASLIPDDPSVLITIAGMLPFKSLFLGQTQAEYKRVTTSQKCVRTNDIENVGETARHHTFFEMLGNFSFGDYFKKTAIQWAWELSTQEYGLPISHIWDDEAYEIWQQYVPKERIVKMGEEDNFWSVGSTGPCGPCSELYYDFHPEQGTSNVDLNDDRRFIEFYNLVFMEQNRAADGSISELKNKNIDTGMGLERMAQILQRVPNNYETDLISPIVQTAAKLAERDFYRCGEMEKRDLKVMADHMRAVTYLISDGVVPSNLGRGYILRRLIRRIIMKGYLFDIKEPFTAPLCRMTISLSVGCDPNVERQENRILSILAQEEEQFTRTLASGQKKLSEFLMAAQDNQSQITGKQAFMLFDTYGFPLEITEEIAKSQNTVVDVAGFHEEMTNQKARSKSARQEITISAENGDFLNALMKMDKTEFLGYDTLTSHGTVLALIQDGQLVPEVICEEGGVSEFEMVLDQSPFYAESGGQIADKGMVSILGEYGDAQMSVLDVQNAPSNGLILHKMSLPAGLFPTPLEKSEICVTGRVQVQEKVKLEVNSRLRQQVMCHHTATHLLQSAIKKVLGSEVGQQGSLVSHDRFRFDFNFGKALTEKQISEIENLVNTWITENRLLSTTIMDLDAAKAAGATAMFGEKYSQNVRVVDVAGVSKELCGGTHVSNTSELLAFKVVSESAIQSGIRRIEAVAGPAAIQRFHLLSELFTGLKNLLKVDIDKIPSRVQELQKEVISAAQEKESLEKEIGMLKAESLLTNCETIENCSLLVGELAGVDGKSLQAAASHLLDKLSDPAAVVLGASAEDRVAFAVGFTSSLTKNKFLHAGKFVASVAEICGGRGGGRPELAQAGGKNPEQLTEALEFAKSTLTSKFQLMK